MGSCTRVRVYAWRGHRNQSQRPTPTFHFAVPLYPWHKGAPVTTVLLYYRYWPRWANMLSTDMCALAVNSPRAYQGTKKTRYQEPSQRFHQRRSIRFRYLILHVRCTPITMHGHPRIMRVHRNTRRQANEIKAARSPAFHVTLATCHGLVRLLAVGHPVHNVHACVPRLAPYFVVPRKTRKARKAVKKNVKWGAGNVLGFVRFTTRAHFPMGALRGTKRN